MNDFAAIALELRALRHAVEALGAEVARLRRPTSPEALQALLEAVEDRYGARTFTVADLIRRGLVHRDDGRAIGRALVRQSRVGVVGNSRDGLVYVLRYSNETRTS